jgi:hypothetical protein
MRTWERPACKIPASVMSLGDYQRMPSLMIGSGILTARHMGQNSLLQAQSRASVPVAVSGAAEPPSRIGLAADLCDFAPAFAARRSGTS